MYCMKLRVRYSEVNKQKKVDLAQIINYFQDCSTFHSEDVGYGLEVLEKIGRVWFLCSWQVEVERYPSFGEELTIGTLAYDRNDLYAYRNFVMIDKEGNQIAKANSIWFLVDTCTQKPLKITEDDVKMYRLEQKIPMKYRERKVKVPKEMQKLDTFLILKSHIDTNGHVNNGQYIRFAQEYIASNFCVTSMRVDYKRAAKLGEEVVSYISKEENICMIKLCDKYDKTYVVVEFTGKYI